MSRVGHTDESDTGAYYCFSPSSDSFRGCCVSVVPGCGFGPQPRSNRGLLCLLLSGPGLDDSIKAAFVFIHKRGLQTLFSSKACDSVLASAFLSFPGTCVELSLSVCSLSPPSPHPLRYPARLCFLPFLSPLVASIRAHFFLARLQFDICPPPVCPQFSCRRTRHTRCCGGCAGPTPSWRR